MTPRNLTIASAAVAAALLLAGCAPTTGSGSNPMPGMDHSASPMSPGDDSTEANMSDQMFVEMMIPHHEQAIEMSDLILGKDGVDPRVLDLAQQIKDAQGPEIEQMNGWLEEWGIPAMSGDGMDGMDHGDGMMSEQDMAELEAATGNDAARRFLEQMIVHHQGAIDMAESEVENGQHPDVIELAEQIIDGQTAEIATMEQLLTEL